jgi:hypothetical protein
MYIRQDKTVVKGQRSRVRGRRSEIQSHRDGTRIRILNSRETIFQKVNTRSYLSKEGVSFTIQVYFLNNAAISTTKCVLGMHFSGMFLFYEGLRSVFSGHGECDVKATENCYNRSQFSLASAWRVVGGYRIYRPRAHGTRSGGSHVRSARGNRRPETGTIR